ncbi:MAG TPA: 3,4-dihydroxy-2-butanone-4-phosphate synthase, partial [Phycisphaerales bacterium]|nr:3,4-dihydroxy-2-butanone-4-phosphate synthase [Phycisphaerales bacterium]
MPLAPIEEVLDELRRGRMIVLRDDEDRENEGDLVLPAEHVSPEAITFMLTEARGYLCLSLTEADCDRLELGPQGGVNTTARGTAFTVSIDGHPRHGFTTGVSARERARCIRMAIDPASRASDFVRPGHINPLRAREGGVLVRTGQTEGSIDLCRLAGLRPAALIIEIMRDDGEMARGSDLESLCARHGLKMCSVAQVIAHRLARESLVRRADPASGTIVRTRAGAMRLFAYHSVVDSLPQLALTVGGVGDLGADGAAVPAHDPTLVRVHRRHLLGDVFLDTDSAPEGPTGEALHASMRMIAEAGRGAIVYLRPDAGGELDGPGGSLERAIQQGRAGADADGARVRTAAPRAVREIGIGSQILRDLGLGDLRLLTDHETEWPGLEGFGLRVVERVAIRRAG